MAVLGGGAVSYERGTPVPLPPRHFPAPSPCAAPLRPRRTPQTGYFRVLSFEVLVNFEVVVDL